MTIRTAIPILLVSLLFAACEFEGHGFEPPFEPPLLLSTDISSTFVELHGPFTLPFQRTGRYAANDDGFVGYTFESPGELVEARLRSAFRKDKAVLALYGPRNASGTWGKALAWAEDIDRAQLQLKLTLPGRYLVLVGRLEDDRHLPGDYTLDVDCNGQSCMVIQPPDCPIECGLACLNGFKKDERGCLLCECVDTCSSELDCPPGQVCANGHCEGECQCNLAYEPVCGGDGETYANRCEAACAGVAVVREGECSPICLPPVNCATDCPWGRKVDSSGCESCECKGPCEICERGWEPICSLNNRTFSNACLAECQGEGVAYLGACRPHCPAFTCELSCEGGFVIQPDGCPTCQCQKPSCIEEVLEPVCGEDGNTYPSACEALALGIEVAIAETCPSYQCGDDSGCPSTMACLKDTSSCIMGSTGECQGVCVRQQACDISTPTLWCPKGYECVDGGCMAECRCSAIYEPVCGVDGRNYDNTCIAHCQGLEVAKAGRCCAPHDTCRLTAQDCPGGFAYDGNGCPLCECRTEGTCSCGDIDNPVCVELENGDMLDFTNACFAGCQGHIKASEGPCN